jgi:glycosyltransferase involved in cell wall biosynthesis
MRITLATGPTLPVPALDGGAVHRFWQHMAPEFVRAGHAVIVFARADARQPAEERIDGVHYRRWGGFAARGGWRDVLADWRYARGAVRRLPPGEVLVINDLCLPWFLRRRAQLGRVVIAAGRMPKGQFRWYPRVDLVAASSRAVAHALRTQTPALSERIAVLPYAIDTRVLSAAPHAAQGGVLYAGRLHPEKGLTLLLDAWRALQAHRPDETLTLIGPWRTEQGGGGEAFVDMLRRRAEGLRVRILPPEFEPSRLVEHYRAHAVFCYPSLAEHGETFGVAPLEAMACGALPVCSALPCFEEYLEHRRNGWRVDCTGSNAVARLADALAFALSAPEREAMRSAALATAAGFAYPNVAAQWLAAFERLLAPAAPPASVTR